MLKDEALPISMMISLGKLDLQLAIFKIAFWFCSSLVPSFSLAFFLCD
jgi:hypothetical protein